MIGSKTKLSLRKLQAGELEGRQKKIDQITQQIRQYKQYNTGSELNIPALGPCEYDSR